MRESVYSKKGPKDYGNMKKGSMAVCVKEQKWTERERGKEREERKRHACLYVNKCTQNN